MKKRVILAAGITALVLLLILFLIFLILPGGECENGQCWNEKLMNCKKGSYVQEADDASWEHTIHPSFDCMIGKCSKCNVNVRLLAVKQGTVDFEKIQGLEMECLLAFGFTGNPQDNLENCHGLLKEELQNMIIKKMHSYILTNVGKVGEELNKAI